MRQDHGPRVESSCRHGGGNPSLTGEWLLDSLDRLPPEPGETLMLYLCHHPNDWGYFNEPASKLELAQALLDAFERLGDRAGHARVEALAVEGFGQWNGDGLLVLHHQDGAPTRHSV